MSTATLPSSHYQSNTEQVTETDSILERIAAGDKTAVDECIQTYGPLVWSLALRFCQSRSDAEDASQEIFLAIWQNANRFDSLRGTESSFVSLLARRRLIDRYRKKSLPATVDVDSVDVGVAVEVDQQMTTSEEAEIAAGCFKNLSAVQQQVLGLSIQEGVSHRGISDYLQIPLGTVKTYARRGLLQLRDCMKSKSVFVSGGAQ